MQSSWQIHHATMTYGVTKLTLSVLVFIFVLCLLVARQVSGFPG